MTSRVYLDYAATSPLDKRVLDAMMPYLTQDFGNASTLYEEGRVSHEAVEKSRHDIATAIGCRDPYELVFTSGGTESDNTAVMGIALAAKARLKKSLGPGHVICSSFEHKAVLEPVAKLKSLGFDVSHVSPRSDGFVHPDDLEKLIRQDTVLVSVMAANNEIGTIQPLSELAEVAHSHNVPFHTDAVAGMGKMHFSIREFGVDSVSFTAHKICGPKGIGALYVSKKVPFQPLILGGGQEKGRRSGTSDTPGAIGLAKALELCKDELDVALEEHAKMRDSLISKLTESGCGITTPIDIEPGNYSSHLSNVVPLLVPKLESETLVMKLDEMGFSVSGGSACTSATTKASHVLTSIGVSDDKASGFLRISFGRFTTQDQLDAFADALISIVRNAGA